MLTDPIARLVLNVVHAGVDEEHYDLRAMALGAVDIVVGSMGFAREAGGDEVFEALPGLAARDAARPSRAVA